MANDIDKTSPHYKGDFGSIYEVNKKFPTGGVAGDFVVIEGWAHYWNADRASWCVNAERDSYWDELITNIIEKFKLVRGATYMGVASLDTVPAKAIGAKMYYFATVAGTYKNFGDLAVPQGINVLYSENGSSWVNTTLLEVAQELGVSTKKVVSQKALNDALAKKADKEEMNRLLGTKANTADVNTKFTEEQERVDGELEKKFDKESVVQESGEAEDKVMSQKAVSDKLSDLSNSVAYASHFYQLKGKTPVNYQSQFLPNVPYRLLVKNINRDTNNNTVDCRIYVSLCNDDVDVKKITDTTSKDNSDIIVDFQLTEQEASSVNSVRLYSSRGNTVFDVVIFEKTTEIINRIEQNNEKIKDLEAISTLSLYEEANINGDSVKFVPIQLQTGLTYEFKFVAKSGGVSVKTTNSASSSDIAEIVSNGLPANSTINFTPSKQSKYILISTNANVIDGEIYINNLHSNASLKEDIVNNKHMLLDKAAFYTKNAFVSSSYPNNTYYLQDVFLSVNKSYIFNVNILNNPKKITVSFQIVYVDKSVVYSPSYSESFTYKLTPEKDVKNVILVVLAKNATSVSDTLELEYYLIEGTNYIDYSINKLKEEVSEDIKETASIPNQLLLIPSKKRCITGNVPIKERMQASMDVSKSFSPCIDYRGQLCFEELTNLSDFNSNSSVLFAEQITTTGWDYNSKIRSWISLDEKNFTNYTTEKGLQEYVDGEKINYVTSLWNHACNDNNLHLIMVYFKHEDNRNFKSIFWSLDGGRTYEPAVNNFRSHFEITDEELATAKSVEIDGKTYQVVSPNEAQTALKSNFDIYEDSPKLIDAAKKYLEDKIIVSNNKQDALRFCAEKLISNGYYVRLNENNLIVYNKVIGTSGNGASKIKVANVGKMFENAEDMSLSEAAKKSGIFYPTNIKYAKTEDEIPYSDFADISSILYINKEWYFFFNCQKDTTGIYANLCLKISNIENIETSRYRYTVIRNSGDIIYCEPCATFDKINNRIYVGMRTQVNYPVLSYYSDDLGQTFKPYYIPNTSLAVTQGNAYIFRVFNPTLVYQDFFNHGYDRPNSTKRNYTMLVCCVFARYVGAVFTTTAKVDYGWDGNMENLKWSEWKPLNHINDDNAPNFGGFEHKGCYFNDPGFASVGSLCYSRRYRGLIVGYQGIDVVNKKISYTISIAKEPC